MFSRLFLKGNGNVLFNGNQMRSKWTSSLSSIGFFNKHLLDKSFDRKFASNSFPQKRVVGGKVVMERKRKEWIDSNKQINRNNNNNAKRQDRYGENQFNNNNQPQKKKMEIPQDLTPRTLSGLIGVRIVDILKVMIKMGIAPTSSNQMLETAVVDFIASEFNIQPIRSKNEEKDIKRRLPSTDATLPKRPPVVAIVGHINHGKTTLLDTLRLSTMAAGEAGGITQRIGPFEAKLPDTEESITFIDTPGHEVFSSMREVALDLTDIALVVIAADDGLQPQTIEAIEFLQQHAKPFIIVLNKIDKHTADAEAVKKDLLRRNIIIEDFGGEIQCVSISAKNGDGLDLLGQAILDQSELMELKSDSSGGAELTIVESHVQKGLGFYASAVVRAGTLNKQDHFICGNTYGRVRLMFDCHNSEITKATPSNVVSLSGFRELPEPGDDLIVLPSEKECKSISDNRVLRAKLKAQQIQFEKEQQLKQEQLAKEREEKEEKEENGENDEEEEEGKEEEEEKEKRKELVAIIKADSGGSVEAIKQGIAEIPESSEVKITVVQASVGSITESDINFARTAGAKTVIGFNSRVEPRVERLAREYGINILQFQVIYKLFEFLTNEATSMLAPKIVYSVVGSAQILQVFEINDKKTKVVSKIAGCRVSGGSIMRSSVVRVLRNGATLFEGKLSSLKHLKDDVREVKSGLECGMSFQNFDQFQEGDLIQAVKSQKQARTLGESN